MKNYIRIQGRTVAEVVDSAIAASLRQGAGAQLSHAAIVGGGLRWDQVRRELERRGQQDQNDQYMPHDQYDQYGCSFVFRGRDASGSAWTVSLGSAVAR